jgi:peroxiredoxin
MNWIVFGMTLPWVIVGLFVVLGCWIGFQLVHQNGRLLSHLEALEQRVGQIGSAPAPIIQSPVPPLAPQPAPAAPPALPLGSAAPDFELPDLNGARKRLADFRGKRLLLLFFNPGCGFCTRMAPDLAALPVDGRDGRPIPLVITTGDAEENRKLFAEHGVQAPVLLQPGMEIASQYRCNGTPMGYLVDENGRIASELAIGAPALLALTPGPAPSPAGAQGPPVPGQTADAAALGGKRGVEESKLQRDGLPAGTPAPEFRLPLLHGGEVSLSEYRGRKVLLVFSDPKCGPCEQLAPQLEQHARRGSGIQVLLVSRGEEEANRAKAAQHGLTFPIVLQRQWEISREYGKFATPIAYLIDESGIIAKEVAVGIEPILALLTPPPAVPTNGKGKVPHREAAGRRR